MMEPWSRRQHISVAYSSIRKEPAYAAMYHDLPMAASVVRSSKIVVEQNCKKSCAREENVSPLVKEGTSCCVLCQTRGLED